MLNAGNTPTETLHGERFYGNAVREFKVQGGKRFIVAETEFRIRSKTKMLNEYA
jgi:hypothetical protein